MNNDIKYYFLLHGHDLNNNDFSLDANLANYIEYLLDNKNDIKSKKELKIINPKIMINNSSKYLNSLFNIHKVGYLNNKILMSKLNNKDIYTIDEAIDLYNNAGVKVEPYLLPIRFKGKADNYGSLIIASPIINEELITKNINVYF